MKAIALLVALAAAPLEKLPPPLAQREDEVEVTSGAVTGLACAIETKRTGDLARLTSCPPAEATKEIVVYDVAEGEIYRISAKAVYRYELEQAFSGGSIDFEGVVTGVDDTAATVDVTKYTITPRPKPGSFKGCL